MIGVKSLRNENMENGIRFANRYQNHVNKQPMIVIFSKENKPIIRQKSSLTKINEKNGKRSIILRLFASHKQFIK